MTFHYWWRLHTLGWSVWLPAIIVFAGFVAWASPTPARRPLLPWAFLVVFLCELALEDYQTAWHQVYWSSKPVWGAGLLASAVVALLPLATCLGLASKVTERLSHQVSRTLSLAFPALMVRLILGAHLFSWIQRALLD